MNDEEINERIDEFLRREECIVKVEHNGKQYDCVTIGFAVKVFSLRAELRGIPKEYSRSAVHSAVRSGHVQAFSIGEAKREYYSVESLKSTFLSPQVKGKPIQKTQSRFRPPREGYSKEIVDCARRLFAGRRLEPEEIEGLCAFRKASEGGRTRIRQNPTLSHHAIADYLNWRFGRGDDGGYSGMRITYGTVQMWHKKWQKEQSRSTRNTA
jgi:hypothetical protein